MQRRGDPGGPARYARAVHLIELLLPDFTLILVGYLLCLHTPLNRPVWLAVEQLVYYFLFPIFLFQSIVRAPLDAHTASTLMGAGLALGASGIALAYALPHLPGLRGRFEAREHAACAQVAFRFNSFIGLAVAERVAGPTGQQMIAVLIGVCVPLANVGAVWPMARHGERGFVRELARNPLIIATVLGLAANGLGLVPPPWLGGTLQRIGSTSIALGLMAAGAGMQLRSVADNKALAGGVLTIRHLLLPIVAWLLARAFGLGAVETTALLIFSALPTSSSCYVLAARMGYNGAYVAGLVTLSTALGALSLPWALASFAPIVI